MQGGSPITLADAANAQGISWSRAGWIVFAPSPNDTLLRIPDTGGTPVPATRLSTGDLGHVAPQFLPDGRHFVYLVRAPRPRKGIYVGSIDSLKRDSSDRPAKRLCMPTRAISCFSRKAGCWHRSSTQTASQ